MRFRPSATPAVALLLCLAALAAAGAPAAQAEALLPLTTPRHPLLAAPALAPPAARPALPAAQTPPARPVLPQAAFAASPGKQCRAAIRAAEQAAGIPSQLMAAIGRIESGRRGPDGSVDPWPWSFNAEGVDHVFDTKPQAIAAVQALQAQGVHSIDVGCMQVNLMFHPTAFASLEEAFDPVANARYAARFLLDLKQQTGAWPTATAWYHSANPGLGEDYERKVLAVWPEEQRHQTDTPAAFASAQAFGGTQAFGGGAPFSRRGGPFLPAVGGLRLPHPPGRLLPLASATGAADGGGGGGVTGRGLAAYRALPIPLAARAAPLLPAPARDPGHG